MPNSSVILISASAGSGKTSRLTKKYIELLLEGNEISNLLAITFTDNAAHEMKTRVIKYLKAIAFGDKDQIKKFNFPSDSNKAILILDKIFENYDWFNIKTIDSFITSIFSSIYQNLDYGSEFSVRFNYENIVRSEIFRFLSTKIINNDTVYIDKFIDLMNKTKNKIIFDPIQNIVEYFSEFFKKEDDYLKDIREISDLEEKELLKEISLLEEQMFINVEKIEDKELIFVYSNIITGKKNKDIELIANTIVKNKGLIKKNICKRKVSSNLIEIEKILYSISKKILFIKAKLYYVPYIGLYCQFRNYLRDAQKKSRVVILSSMYREIYKMLKDNKNSSISEIYMKLSSKFTHFFIDEFQDTSYAQWSLIKPFIEEALSRGGSVFLIGDIKQAIYMFRNADWHIMMDMILNPKSNLYLDTSTLSRGIEVINVELNYRSSDVILDYVNNFFSSDEFKNYLEDNDLSFFENIYKVNHKSDETKDGYVETQIVDESNMREVFIKIIEDIVSRFNLSSIAILSYKNETLDEIARWLGEEKIPVFLYGELDIRKNKTIQTIMSLLRFIKNQNDEFNFSMFLLSPLVAKKLGDKDLSQKIMYFMHNKSNRIDLFKYEFKKIWEELIHKIIKESSRKDIYSLINMIVSEFDIIKNFPHDNAFVIKLIDLSYELIREEKIYSLPDFINFIDKADEDDERFSVEISPKINAIKLMTFHKSKGLEFDVVINFFIQTTMGGSRIYYDLNDQNINLYNINQESSEVNDNLSKIYKSTINNDRVSDINTIYVALTRAKFELYNIVVNKSRSLKILNLFKDKDIRGIKIKGINKTKEKELRVNEFEAKIFKQKNLIDIVNVKKYSQEIEIGNIFHSAISLIISKRISIDDSIKYAFVNEKVAYDKDVFDKVKELVNITLNNPKIASITKSKSEIKSEVEFSDICGNIKRADLLVFDRERIIVIDFKTGDYNKEDEKQILNYLSILKKIYKQHNIFGLVYYVNYDKIHEY
ncbi:MAG: UvrD-helicase domain-containing protein [Elusimicrobiales bacterium]|nr:UvrD-helicase domain-containing protein [Elusimicrobiales bacterium]